MYDQLRIVAIFAIIAIIAIIVDAIIGARIKIITIMRAIFLEILVTGVAKTVFNYNRCDLERWFAIIAIIAIFAILKKWFAIIGKINYCNYCMQF